MIPYFSRQKSSMFRLASCEIVAALSILYCGCQPAPSIFHVQGVATYDGRPIPIGRIYFDPTAGGSEQGIAEIVDGRFDTRASDLGIKGGTYAIRVQGFDGVGGDELPWGQPLFNEFELKAELKGEDQEFNVDVPK